MMGSLKDMLKKPSPYGPDVDLSMYEVGEPRVEGGLDDVVSRGIGEVTARIGVSEAPKLSYVQVNESAFYRLMEDALRKYGVRVVPLKLALERFNYVKDLSWRLVAPDTDKYTAFAYLYGGEVGYFIYVPPKTKVPIPIYTCLAITSDRKAQIAHNIVYVDEGSEAHVVTGCAVPHGVREGLHVGISEFYVARDARLTFSMIHAWSEGLHVRPRTAVSVGEGGEYVSYYIIYSPVASLQTYPSVRLGSGGRAYMASVIAGSGGGVYDVGSRALLDGINSSAELASRVVATDRSEVYARAEVTANEVDTKGHIECLGLLLSDTAKISSIPVITSNKPKAMLSHEAAIGVIAQEELEYLMSKGFKEGEAKAILVRGFMSIEVPGIPPVVRAEVSRVIDMVSKHAVG